MLVVLSSIARAEEPKRFHIFTWTTQQHELHDGLDINVWTFQPELLMSWGIPGYTMEVNEGDSVEVVYFNQSQGDPHSIHFHGLDVDQENDGVPQLSWDVEHGEERTYRFRAMHAGTYIYHCHVQSPIHVQMGMYGLFIVKAKNGLNEAFTSGPKFDAELRWLFSEVDTAWRNHDMHEVDSLDHSHVPPYHPSYFLLNGQSQDQLRDSLDFEMNINEHVLLRLANVGYYKNELHFPKGVNATVVSSDGRPFRDQVQRDSLTIYPGERYQIMLQANEEFVDSIKVKYINLSTDDVHGVESVTVTTVKKLVEEESGISVALLQDKIDLYPTLLPIENPVVNINNNGYIESIKVFDVNGQLISHIDEVGEKLKFPVVIRGQYIIKVRIIDHSTIIKKVSIL